MAIKLWGWVLQKEKKGPVYNEDDRLACFILMAYTEKINALFAEKGFSVHISDEERNRYLKDGKVPVRIVSLARQFRQRFVGEMHLLLDIEKKKVTGTMNYHQLPALNAFFMSDVLEKVRNWNTTRFGTPYHKLFEYHSMNTDEMNEKIEDSDIQNRHLVWNFKYSNERTSPRKHVNALYDAVIPLSAHVRSTFGELAEKLTLFCIPASTQDVHWLRYREFSRMFCERSGMKDSFHYVSVTEEKTPLHLGGKKKTNFTLDEDYFHGKVVIVFDDILTTGGTLELCRQELEKAGAKVLAAYFLGETVKKEN